MNSKLIVLTNCSERKRSGAKTFRLAKFPGSIAEKARLWTDKLSRWSEYRLPAIERYQGDHWTASLTLVRKAEFAGWNADLWVASAGYGLIPADALIHSYAATFAGNHDDSVGAGTSHTPKIAGQKWWERLGHWPGPIPGSPRTLVTLAERNPDAAWLVLMSPTYLDAISADLIEAKTHMTNPDRLVIVSGTPGPADVDLKTKNWVPALEVCRGVLGGSCGSLNARVAGYLASHFSPEQWSGPYIQEQMNLWAASLPPLDRPSRQGITDKEAVAFIRKRLRDGANPSHTALLRELRSTGLACEQKRFRKLFQSVDTSS